MDLIWIILVIALIGFLINLIITHIPMAPIFRTAIIIITIIAVILLLIKRFGNLIPNVL